jgi:hypothetical protein
MAKDWLPVVTANAEAWDILPRRHNGLYRADTALAASKNETTHTPVATARCREAFEALNDKERDIKRRYFLSPPLTASDLAALGLSPHDPHPTPSGKPTAEVWQKAVGFLPRSLRLAANSMQLLYGNYWLELGGKLVYITGSPSDPANKGCRIWYSVVAPGEKPPVNPRELRESFFTRQKKDVIEFDYGDSGKTAYFAVQVENDGKKGPWGPMVNAFIP